jgi:hypothetical protein
MSVIHNNWFSSSTASASNYHKPADVNTRIKRKVDEIKDELKVIAEEEEEDKQKHLPIFDIKDLDI